MEKENMSTTMKRDEKRIVVAVDESEESMHALSWCLQNIVDSHGPNYSGSTLILLYVKPPPPIHSFFDAAGTYLLITVVNS